MTKAQREKFKRHIRIALREAREAAGMGQPQVAKKLRVTQQMVANWENGIKPVATDRLVEYCEVVGISPWTTGAAARAKAGR